MYVCMYMGQEAPTPPEIPGARAKQRPTGASRSGAAARFVGSRGSGKRISDSGYLTRRRTKSQKKLYSTTVGSKKLERGCRMIYAGSAS